MKNQHHSFLCTIYTNGEISFIDSRASVNTEYEEKYRLSEVQKFLKLDFETFTNGLKCFINQNNLAMLQ